jgi:hypothetical protein
MFKSLLTNTWLREHGRIDPSQALGQAPNHSIFTCFSGGGHAPYRTHIGSRSVHSWFVAGDGPTDAAEVPQSIRFQHEQTISRLSHFAQSEDREFAAAAQKAVTFLKEQGC